MPVLRTASELETFESLVLEIRKGVLAEIELHKRLLENAEIKNKAILSRDLDRLQDLTRWDEAILEEVAKWEENMERATRGLAVLWRVDFSTLTMSKLVDLLAEEPEAISRYVSELKEDQKILQSILLELKELNDKNTLLLRRSLAVVNYSLDVILGKKPESSVYDKSGRRQKEKDGNKSIFDAQV